MFDLYHLTEVQILAFSLVLLRMISFLFSSAIFSMPALSTPARILLSLVLAILVYPTIHFDPGLMQGLSNDLIFLAGKEVIVGLCLGFLTRMFFFCISMTGEMVSMSLGLNSAQMFNPLLGSQGNIIEHFHVTLGGLIFFLVNGHHILLGALVQSFEFIHVGKLSFQTQTFIGVVQIAQNLLLITVKMSAPVVISILMTNIAMGLLSRAIPQMNVFVASFPVTIMLGLVIMMICIPLFIFEVNELMNLTGTSLLSLMKTL